MCTDSQGMKELQKWINQNRPRLRQVFVRAALRIDAISEMQTDQDASDPEYIRQKVSGIVTSSRAVLEDYIQEETISEFQDQSQEILDALEQNSETMVEENMDDFIDALVDHIVAI